MKKNNDLKENLQNLLLLVSHALEGLNASRKPSSYEIKKINELLEKNSAVGD